MNRFDAIAFDLDGTLIDSAGGIAHALNAALADEGLGGFALDTWGDITFNYTPTDTSDFVPTASVA